MGILVRENMKNGLQRVANNLHLQVVLTPSSHQYCKDDAPLLGWRVSSKCSLYASLCVTLTSLSVHKQLLRYYLISKMKKMRAREVVNLPYVTQAISDS